MPIVSELTEIKCRMCRVNHAFSLSDPFFGPQLSHMDCERRTKNSCSFLPHTHSDCRRRDKDGRAVSRSPSPSLRPIDHHRIVIVSSPESRRVVNAISYFCCLVGALAFGLVQRTHSSLSLFAVQQVTGIMLEESEPCSWIPRCRGEIVATFSTPPLHLHPRLVLGHFGPPCGGMGDLAISRS